MEICLPGADGVCHPSLLHHGTAMHVWLALCSFFPAVLPDPPSSSHAGLFLLHIVTPSAFMSPVFYSLSSSLYNLMLYTWVGADYTYERKIQYLSLVHFLSIMILNSCIYLRMWIYRIPLCVWSIFVVSIHSFYLFYSSVDEHLSWFHFSTSVNSRNSAPININT